MQNKMFGRTEQQQPPSEPPSGSATAGIVGGPGSRSGPTMMSTAGRKLSSAALRRELWRETPQQPLEDTTNPGTCANVSITRIPSSKTSTTTMSNSNNAAADNKITATGDQVFKFDSFDRDRYLSGSSSSETTGLPIGGAAASAAGMLPSNVLTVHEADVHHLQLHATSSQDEIFSPASGRSPHSSMSSPQVSVDSPRICFSPLRIKDSIEEEEDVRTSASGGGLAVTGGGAGVAQHLPRLSIRDCESPQPSLSISAASTLASTNQWLEPNQVKLMPHTAGGGLSRPISPNPSISPTTPISPSATPLHALRHLPAYLTEVYRRRCLSDTDLSSSWEDLKHAVPPRGQAGPHPQSVGSGQHPQQVLQQAVPRIQQAHSLTYHNTTKAAYRSIPQSKGSSLESEASSTTQESPLDLSVRSSISSSTGGLKNPLAASMDSIQSSSGTAPASSSSTASSRQTAFLAGKGRSRSSTGRGSADRDRYPDRLSLDRLDVVEAASSGGASTTNDVAYVCPICGQM